MTLSGRGIALQGFALTPIAMAVQGLIAILQEEEEIRQQIYGGKRRPQAATRHSREAESDDDIRRAVLDKWEAIDAAKSADAQAKAARLAVREPTPRPPEQISSAAILETTRPGRASAGVLPGVKSKASAQARHDDEAMLLLLLEES